MRTLRSAIVAGWIASLSLLSIPALSAAEGPGPATGEVRLATGVVARYEYHFDHNSLRDSRRAGDALIALTSSRNLVRFEGEGLRPTREHVEAAGVTCLGSGAGDTVLAGLEDGRICRVDPATLALTEVARVPNALVWIGVSSGGDPAKPGIVAVTFRPARDDPWSGTWTVHDLASGKTTTIEPGATTFLLDRRRRLWIGGDQGEWGGSCSCLELETGKLVTLAGLKDDKDDKEPRWDGVYGFVELGDGTVLAHGGTAHMGLNEAFVRRVDRGKAERLYFADNTLAFQAGMEGKTVPRASRPEAPITHLVESRPGEILAFSYSEMYYTDPGFTTWKRFHDLQVHYRWGRPDAMGSYPAVSAVHVLEHPKGALLCTTVADGFVRIVDGKETHHAVPGQFGAQWIARIEDTSEGTLMVSGDDRQASWILRPGGWEVAALAPPVEHHPEEPRFARGKHEAWYSTKLLVGQGGAVTTISATAVSPGTRTTARWRQGRSEVLGRENSSLTSSSSFITPDGELWNAGFGELLHFEGGRWVSVAKLPGADPGGPRTEQVGENQFQIVGQGLDVGYDVRAVGDQGPPWVLLDPMNDQLLRLAHGPKGKDPRLTSIPVVESGKPLKVLDALPWSKGTILLATDKGLRTFDPATDRIAATSLPVPAQDVTTLCRDGSGRLWLGGAGLWMLDADGKTRHDLTVLPMTGRPCSVHALAADPKHDDGIIAVLGNRGLVLVRMPPARKP